MTMVWHPLMFALLSALAAIGPALAQENITGVASVIDGDAIEIHGQRIRLGPIGRLASQPFLEDPGSAYSSPYLLETPRPTARRIGAPYRCPLLRD
jgi:hypothetical protein